MKKRSEYAVRDNLDARRRETVFSCAVVAQGIGDVSALRIALVQLWVGVAVSIDLPTYLFKIGQQLAAAWINAQPGTVESAIVALIKGAEQGVNCVESVHQRRVRSWVQKPSIVLRAGGKQLLDDRPVAAATRSSRRGTATGITVDFQFQFASGLLSPLPSSPKEFTCHLSGVRSRQYNLFQHRYPAVSTLSQDRCHRVDVEVE